MSVDSGHFNFILAGPNRINYCQDNGTPEPEFQQHSGEFSVIFRLKKSPKLESNKTLTSRQRNILEILSTGDSLSVDDIL